MSRSALRIAMGAVLSIGAGLGLTIGVMRLMHVDVQTLANSVCQARLLPLAAVFLTTVLHLWITAVKWRLIAENAGEGDALRGSFFSYTTIAAVVGQLAPQQVAAIAVRTLAGRLHQRTPVARGAGLAAIDQVLDLLPPAAMLAPALLCLAGWLGPWPGVLMAAAAICVTAAFLPAAVMTLISLAARIMNLPGLRTLRRDLLPATLPPGYPLSTLFGLSVVRYVNLIVRYYLLALCIGTPVSFMTMFEATPVITLVFVVALTPGALGLAELGWVGVLSAAGLPAGAAAEYALSARILVFACVAVNALFSLPLLLRVRPRLTADPAPSPRIGTRQ